VLFRSFSDVGIDDDFIENSNQPDSSAIFALAWSIKTSSSTVTGPFKRRA
jgi:uncharacterized membrane protein